MTDNECLTVLTTPVKHNSLPSPPGTLAPERMDITISWSGSATYIGEVIVPPNQITAYRHNNGATIAYWDGHVRLLPATDISLNGTLWDMAK